MTESRRHPVRRLLLIFIAVVVLLIVVREPFRVSPPTSVTEVQIVRGLGLRPVLSATEGGCPSTTRSTTIWSSDANTCYEVSATGMRVTRLQSAQVVQSVAGGWNLHLTLTPQDTPTFTRLSSRLSQQPAPHNELAIVLHGPPGGQLLAAPAIIEPVNYLELDGGPTESTALALLAEVVE